MKAYFEGDKDVLVFKPIPASKIGRPKKNVPVTNVVKSNADHIRYMTDEELAEFLCRIDVRKGCTDMTRWSEWIKQPYKEDT